MDLTEMMDNLVIDLKMTLDTEISTGEATRCIERAVDDLSRHLPRERIYETTYKNVVTDDSFVASAAQSDTSLVNADGIGSAVDGAIMTLVTNWLDIPRPVKITIGDSGNGITTMTIIVKGRDADGIYREERFYRRDGKVQTGKLYFASVTEVEIDEITGNGSGDTLSVGYGPIAGIWINLDNPVEPGTESIYSGESKSGTKYKLDTDYEMDYANGRVTLKSDGSMVAGDTYYANYNKSNLSIDISAIIPVLTRITKVIYPANKVPEQSVAFSIWENMMTIGSPRTGTSQESLVDGEHIAIHYEMRHGPPTETGSGSYPELLDQVVAIGAAGYALLIEAIQYEQQAVTDLSSSRAALTAVTGSGLHGLIKTALDIAAVLLKDASSDGKIALALDKVAKYLETHDADASGADNAKAILENIMDDTTNLRNGIAEAMLAMNLYLDDVDTTDLAPATYGAEGLVASVIDGAFINKLTDGKNVPERFAELARTKIGIAQVRIQAALGFAQEAAFRLSNLRSYIEEAGGWMRMGEVFIAEASQLIAQVNAAINEGATRIAQLDRHIAEAAGFQETANTDMVLSDRFRAEAQIRLIEFHDILKSKAEYRKRVVSVPVTQPH